jgi:hypothetical protein
MKNFTTLHVSNLKIDDLYALCQTTVETAQPVQSQIGELPAAALSQLQINNAAMEAQMNKSRKEELTAPIRDEDAMRDGTLAEVKKTVAAAAAGKDPVRSAAGEKLKIFLTPYWNLSREPLNTETDVLNELLNRYDADPALQQAAAEIGIASLMMNLRTVNNRLDALYRERTAAEAAQTAASASSLKQPVVKSYEHFCDLVQQAANLLPGDVITALFNEMDVMRKKYAALPRKTDKPETDTDSNQSIIK